MNIIKTYDIDTNHRRHNQYSPVLRKKKKKKEEKNNKKNKKKGKRKGKLDIEV
ncbi:MAG: hypothetical protein ACLFSQ_06165 [Candidatus Zixiibacteriota bacterium]